MLVSVDLGDNSEKELTVGDLKSLKLANVWLELKDPTKEEIETVSAMLGVRIDLADNSAVSRHISFRREQDVGIVDLVVISEIVTSKQIYPITIVLSKDYLVTVEKREYQQIIDLVKARMKKTKTDPPSVMTYYLLDEIIDNNFLHLEKMEKLTAKLEEEMLEKPEPATIRRLFRLKTRMVSFNKILWYERGLVFNLKKAEAPFMVEKYRSLFDVPHEYLTRQIDIVETYREIMTDAINVYLSTISNKINSSIKALTVVIFYLTVITTITSFPNTVATFFGISQFGNTDSIIIFTTIILSIALPLVWLWRRKWLKPDNQPLLS